MSAEKVIEMPLVNEIIDPERQRRVGVRRAFENSARTLFETYESLAMTGEREFALKLVERLPMEDSWLTPNS